MELPVTVPPITEGNLKSIAGYEDRENLKV